MAKENKISDKKYVVRVCLGTGCISGGSLNVYEALKRNGESSGLKNVIIDFTGCHGFCQRGPIVDIEPGGIFYSEVKEEDVTDIVQQHLKKGKFVDRLFYRHPSTGETIPCSRDIPFYSRQQRIILRNCGHINPENIGDYLAVGGYESLKKVLSEMTPEQVISEISSSVLRGRGGAGFVTGLKWEFCHREPGKEKYIICNADEGDPGAFMDRSILEADPHSVLEGMVIGAYAIGANQGYIYCRAEYPLALERLRIALRQMEEHGLLGNDILGSGFNFHIKIKEGAGAFVCGEETALIASIEGKRGMPRTRPPFPAISGLWGKPTIINNVKTLASVPVIIAKGSNWYSGIGTEKSKGTVVFALTGKIANSGLVEVPMGIELRELIYEIGGGISGGRKFKAAQTGGPSGGCLPASMLNLSIDYESLTAAGSIMGSGGMIVMDEDTCMVDIARYFLIFTQAESCGKCVPCRVGTRQMLIILERITKGDGVPGDVELLERLANTVKLGSLCGLGQTAPNPVLTTIRYFRSEYEEHINNKRCPALVCKELISFYILPEKCKGCGICFKNCPVGAISGGKKLIHVIDHEKCIKCGTCLDVCPKRFSAVVKVSGEKIKVPERPIPVGK
ncbi:MAG: NADH-quinone oxidoreductase subunit NuoF [Nitrospirota bacterium]